ncbi:hypothetical protein ACE1B6_03405 [Aerosakkonemataceae cyanobacterium BLCC-F154]|uniref:Uncharacterized protein n=1 Tax=Floridaenema fluviatile BLCC-F154 TaxID=3153640 RepID=A0ABV4Y670_9CYAN
MRFLTNKSLLSKAKLIGKSLLVLIFSIFLFVPTPALALDYNVGIKPYVSEVRAIINNSVLPIVELLPNQNYDFGQELLQSIDENLQMTQTTLEKNAKDYKQYSDVFQGQLESLLNAINQPNEDKQKLASLRQQVDLLEDKYDREIINRYGLPVYQLPTDTILSDSFGALVLPIRETIRNLEKEIESLQSKIKPTEEVKREWEIYSKEISTQLVSYKQISRLYDNLRKRIKLASNKVVKVKQYAAEIQSFSDKDMLAEIEELKQFLTNITENLA